MILIANNPKSKYLTHSKEYQLEWVSSDGSYYAVRNDAGKVIPYSTKNFNVYEGGYDPYYVEEDSYGNYRVVKEEGKPPHLEAVEDMVAEMVSDPAEPEGLQSWREPEDQASICAMARKANPELFPEPTRWPLESARMEIWDSKPPRRGLVIPWRAGVLFLLIVGFFSVLYPHCQQENTPPPPAVEEPVWEGEATEEPEEHTPPVAVVEEPEPEPVVEIEPAPAVILYETCPVCSYYGFDPQWEGDISIVSIISDSGFGIGLQEAVNFKRHLIVDHRYGGQIETFVRQGEYQKLVIE